MCQTRRSSHNSAIAMILCLAILAPLSACGDTAEAPPADTRSVSLGVSKEALSALVYIARDEGLFEQVGLDVEIVEYESTQVAMEALLAGEIDTTLAADTPIAFAALNGEPISIIATIGIDNNDLKIVARSDAGISSPADLRGKRVGTRGCSAAHFFLHLFLVKYGMADSDVDMRFDSFENLSAALVAGDLDAVALRQPFVSRLEETLGDRYVLFEEKGLYGKTMNLCVLSGQGAPDAEIQRRLIRALIAAEETGVADTSGRTWEEVADAVGVTSTQLCDCIISEGAVGLRQSLVLGLEDQVRWAMGTGLATAETPPDVLLLIDTGPLDAVAPERVTLIR